MANEIVPSLDEIPKGVEGIRFLLGIMYHRLNEVQATVEATKVEQNTVHDIVDTMSESMRLINTKVETMLPVVDNYRLNEKDIKVAVDQAMKYRDEKLVQSGVKSMFGYVLTALGLVGGVVAFLLSEGIKFAVAYFHK